MTEQEIRRHFERVREVFGPHKHKAIPMFEDCICYPMDIMVRMNQLCKEIEMDMDERHWPEKITQFIQLRDSVTKNPDGPERIYLWPEGNMPVNTVYSDNSDFKYNHDPDFKPYIYELLIPKSRTPRGIILVCAGGDHGECTMTEGYQVCMDFNAMDYQCILLLNRPNHSPYSRQECGADAARAIRYIRSNAERFRVRKDQVAFAGFSNGGVTGEALIQYYSADQTVAEQFPDYIPDALDAVDATPDAFLCIYGPRFKGENFDYSKVKYPPVFFAVGRDDTAMENLHSVYPDLIAHGILAEIHTFAGTPHGKAGIKLVDGTVKYPNFELWLTLADAFMQDIYYPRKKEGLFDA